MKSGERETKYRSVVISVARIFPDSLFNFLSLATLVSITISLSHASSNELSSVMLF